MAARTPWPRTRGTTYRGCSARARQGIGAVPERDRSGTSGAVLSPTRPRWNAPDHRPPLVEVEFSGQRFSRHRVTCPLIDAEPVPQIIDLIEQRLNLAPDPHGGRSATTPTDSGKTADGILSRLKRDDPGLAQQVIDGQVSPNAAALQNRDRPTRSGGRAR